MTGSGPPESHVEIRECAFCRQGGRPCVVKMSRGELPNVALPTRVDSVVHHSVTARETARGITRWIATTAARPTSRAAKAGPSTLGGISEFSALRHANDLPIRKDPGERPALRGL